MPEMPDKFDVLHLQDQYDLAVGALGRLSIERSYGTPIPKYSEIIGAMPQFARKELDSRAEISFPDRLVIVPAIGELTLTELLQRGGMCIESNATWLNNTRGRYIWQHLDDNYHNAGYSSPWRVGILLQDIVLLNKNYDPANPYGEPGLLFPNRTAASQLRQIKKEQKYMLSHGLEVRPITASDYAVAKYGDIVDLDETLGIDRVMVPGSFKEMIKGKRSRQVRREVKTITRFVQYPKANIGGGPHCYDSSNMVGDEYVSPSWSMTRRWYIGARRVMNIPMPG